MALRSRELSAVEHVTDALDRLAADPYNTVITLDDRALERAAALDAELAAGRWRGPLHGVAVGVKDLIDVAGLPTKCGSLVRESVRARRGRRARRRAAARSRGGGGGEAAHARVRLRPHR